MKQGSSLLVVLLIMTSLVLLSTTVWQNTVRTFDVVVEKQIYEQRFYLVHGLFAWTVEAIQQDNALWMQQLKKKDEIKLSLTELLPDEVRLHGYSATLTCRCIKVNTINVHVKLKKNNELVMHMQTTLNKKTKKNEQESNTYQFYTSHWQVNVP